MVANTDEDHHRHGRRRVRLIDQERRPPAEGLVQFLIEERARRSVGVTGFLVSGGGAGAVACWLEVASLYASRPPALVLRLLMAASGLLLAALVVGFIAALAGYKAFDASVFLSAEEVRRPHNSVDRWFAVISKARAIAAALIAAGGIAAFAANAVLALS